jgi:hypothetical protein
MARQTAAARRMPQGRIAPVKGKKTGSVSVVTKRSTATKRRKAVRTARGTTHHLDTIVRVGTAITFAPTGERLRVAKIEDGKITFEKLP